MNGMNKDVPRNASGRFGFKRFKTQEDGLRLFVTAQFIEHEWGCDFVDPVFGLCFTGFVCC